VLAGGGFFVRVVGRQKTAVPQVRVRAYSLFRYTFPFDIPLSQAIFNIL